MDPDKLFKQVKKMNAPDNLWQKVEREISETPAKEQKPRFMEWLGDQLAGRKRVWAVAAVAAALALTIRLAPPIESPIMDNNLQTDDTAEINEFIDQTLGSVFSYEANFEAESGDGDDSTELILFEQFDSILWTNGGKNA